MTKPEATSVLFMADLKRKVSLTPRPVVTSEVKRGRPEESKALYRMRKLYSLSVAHNEGFALESKEQKVKLRLSAYPSARRSIEEKDDSPPPYLGIGWDLHCASESKLPPATSSTPSHEPAKPATGVRLKEAIPVKSFVLSGDSLRREDPPRTWTVSDFYRNAVAVQEGSNREARSSTESLVLKPTAFEEKPDLLHLYRYSTVASQRQAPVPRSLPAPRPTLVSKLMPRAGMVRTNRVPTGFKPQPMNPRLAASQAKQKPRTSLSASESLPLVLDFERFSTEPPASSRSKATGLSRYMVQMRPRDLPPHRIPVDYGFFRKVKRIRS